MRNAASMARGASSLTSEPIDEFRTRLTLIRPRLIETGSISTSTRLTCSSCRKSNAIRTGKPIRMSGGMHIASWTAVPATTPIA